MDPREHPAVRLAFRTNDELKKSDSNNGRELYVSRRMPEYRIEATFGNNNLVIETVEPLDILHTDSQIAQARLRYPLGYKEVHYKIRFPGGSFSLVEELETGKVGACRDEKGESTPETPEQRKFLADIKNHFEKVIKESDLEDLLIKACYSPPGPGASEEGFEEARRYLRGGR